MVSSTYRLNRPAYSQSECITQKQNHMKNKEEIRHYLDTQFSPSEDDMVQIVRNDFDRILNSAASYGRRCNARLGGTTPHRIGSPAHRSRPRRGCKSKLSSHIGD